MTDLFTDNLPRLLLWGLIATVAMTTILQGSQGLGLSRLSLPFLVGTLFTGNRNRAVVIGFIALSQPWLGVLALAGSRDRLLAASRDMPQRYRAFAFGSVRAGGQCHLHLAM